MKCILIFKYLFKFKYNYITFSFPSPSILPISPFLLKFTTALYLIIIVIHMILVCRVHHIHPTLQTLTSSFPPPSRQDFSVCPGYGGTNSKPYWTQSQRSTSLCLPCTGSTASTAAPGMYTDTHQNSLSLFSAASVYVISELTLWFWITN